MGMALALVSCRKNWAGTYAGPITQLVTMPDAQILTDTGSADVVVTDGSSGRVTVTVHGCMLEATQTDTQPTLVAIARTIDCTFPSSDVKVYVTSASLVLTGDTLSWTWTGDAKKGSASGSFASTFTGARAPQ